LHKWSQGQDHHHQGKEYLYPVKFRLSSHYLSSHESPTSTHCTGLGDNNFRTRKFKTSVVQGAAFFWNKTPSGVEA
jgi:hypothetical protein